MGRWEGGDRGHILVVLVLCEFTSHGCSESGLLVVVLVGMQIVVLRRGGVEGGDDGGPRCVGG
jgi:hypothetical protein